MLNNKLLLLLPTAVLFCYSCGPSKAELALQRMQDSIRIADQVKAEIKDVASAAESAKIRNAELARKNKNVNVTDSEPAPLCIDMYGTIGGSGELHFNSYDPSNCTYSYDCSGVYVTRTLKMESYDDATGKLVLNSYELGSGKYLGKFVGTLRGTTYTGTFTNYRGGRVKFNLSE